jgi:hypothetical protein
VNRRGSKERKEKNALKLLILTETKDSPSTSSSGGVLSSHEERNHDVSDLLVRKRLAGLVLLVLEGREHVEVGL